MESRVRVLGHPVHPMLIVFPLGLFVTAVIFDFIHLVSDNGIFAEVGFWNITAGAIGAVLAAITGFLDWTGVPRGTRAKRIGRLHGGANSLVLVLFLISWLARLDRPDHAPNWGLFLLELVALAVAGVAAWLGGEMVDRLGIGVSEDAHPDAPSSLASGGRSRVAR